MDKAKEYRPSKADLAFRDAHKADANDFELARLLKRVSHEYLAVMLSANSGERSKPFSVLFEAELQRRSAGLARQANRIALASLGVALIALIVSIVR